MPMFALSLILFLGARIASATPAAKEITVGTSGQLTHDFDSDGAPEVATVSVASSRLTVQFSGALRSETEGFAVAAVGVELDSVDRVLVDTLPTAVSGVPLVRVVVLQGEEGCGSKSTVYLVSLSGPSHPRARVALTYVDSYSESPANSSTEARFIPGKRQLVLEQLVSNGEEETKSTRNFDFYDGVYKLTSGGEQPGR